MQAGRKRSHGEFELDEQSTRNCMGVAETLALLKKESSHDSALAGKSEKRSKVQAGVANDGNDSVQHEEGVLKHDKDVTSLGDDEGAHQSMKREKDDEGGDWEVAGPRKRSKKSRNKQRKREANGSKSNYPAIGHSSHARLQTQVRLADLQALVLYLLTDGPSPQWCSVRHHHHIKKVVVLLVPGLEKSMFDGSLSLEELAEADESASLELTDGLARTTRGKPISPDEYYPLPLHEEELIEPLRPMAHMFSHIWPVKSPGDDKNNRMHSPMTAMLQSAVPKTDDEKKAKGPGPPVGSKQWRDHPCPVTTFLATREELDDNDYVLHPTHLKDDTERDLERTRRQEANQTTTSGWIDSTASLLPRTSIPSQPQRLTDPTSSKQIIAIDCEMVMTGPSEFSLTRISCVSWDNTVLLDELVKPTKPILDYLTPYSGMTAALLDPITTTLSDIQAKLLGLLTTNTILIGHSLNSDLNALQLTHPNIIDTSVLYPHPRGAPLKSSLKWLSQKYLGRDIQNGVDGHNSIEDARAALDLVKQKSQKGPSWGTAEATSESIFKRVGRSVKAGKRRDAGGAQAQDVGGTSLFTKANLNTTALVDWGVPSRGHGASADVCIGCGSDEDVVAGVRRAVQGDEDGREIPAGGVEFVWARMRELEAVRGWWTSSKTKDNDELRERAMGADEEEAKTGAGEGGENGKSAFAAKSEAISPAAAKLKTALAATIARLEQIHALLPPCTALLVYSGSSDPRPLYRLQAQQAAYKREYASKKFSEIEVKWSDREEAELREACRKARNSVGFVGVK